MSDRRALMLGESNGGDTVDTWELLVDDTFVADVGASMNNPKEYTITGKYKKIFVAWLCKAPSTETQPYDNFTGLIAFDTVQVAKPVGIFNKTTHSYGWFMFDITNLFTYSDTHVHRNNTDPVSGGQSTATAGYIDSITNNTTISKIRFSSANASTLYIGSGSYIRVYGVRA